VDTIKEIIYLSAGIFALFGGIFNWDFLLNANKSKFLVAILTRTGARIFYIIIGLTILIGLLMQKGLLN
jgi:hypothetical protein